MRNLLLMMGAPGSGKSTWIKRNNLDMYTLCGDTIRLQYSSPVMNLKGQWGISQKNDTAVWDGLMKLLEFRMQRGMFTIIDATHSRSKLLKRYEQLCEKYRYRVYIKRFDVDLETLIDRDNHREYYKRVPHDQIELIHNRLKSIEIPKKFNVIEDIHEINEYVDYKRMNLDRRDIYFIGDIHGHSGELKEFIDNCYNREDLYIFLGDYIGRGYDDIGVIKMLSELHDNGNVVLIEGNHERHIRAFGHDETYYHEELHQLITNGFTRKDARVFYRRLWPFIVFQKQNINLLACHGGIPSPYFNFIPTEQLIKGIGKYEDVYENANRFTEFSDDEVRFVQVHGHRSIDTNIELTCNVFNVNGGLGNGGNLHILKFSERGFEKTIVINGHTANYKSINLDSPKSSDIVISDLMSNKDINVNEYGNIVSLNFKRNVFYSRKWDELTIKARGLFVNKKTNAIVARSYDKFFNLDEFRSHSLPNIIAKVKFPVKEYRKENGYLGIIGYDQETDELLFCSKSSLESEHSKWFKSFFNGIGLELKLILKDLNASLVFEVVLPDKDPHIIEYDKPVLYLLDIIKNQLSFEIKEEFNIREYLLGFFTGAGINVKSKELVSVSDTAEELVRNVDATRDVVYEGSVFVDANNFMFKVKSNYYMKWKQLRGIKDTKLYNSSIKLSALAFDSDSYAFLEWCRSTYSKDEAKAKSIIQLRREYLALKNR